MKLDTRDATPDPRPSAEALERWKSTGLDEALAPRAMLLGRLVMRRLDQALAEAGLGLTPAQARAVATLWLHGPMSQQSLATHTEVEPSTLVRTLDVMERDGLARRERDPGDRRAYLVRLTGDGERLVPRLVSLWEEVENDLVEALSPDDVARARKILTAMVERLGEGGSACCG